MAIDANLAVHKYLSRIARDISLYKKEKMYWKVVSELCGLSVIEIYVPYS